MINGRLSVSDDDEQPISVLLAEDDADLCFILSHSLTQGGFRVHEVNTIANMEREILALDNMQSPKRYVDVIVSDIQLADGSVMPLLSKYKHFFAGFPAILITSDKSPEVLKMARRFGIHDVLAKPFDLSALVTTIGHAINCRPVR